MQIKKISQMKSLVCFDYVSRHNSSNGQFVMKAKDEFMSGLVVQVSRSCNLICIPTFDPCLLGNLFELVCQELQRFLSFKLPHDKESNGENNVTDIEGSTQDSRFFTVVCQNRSESFRFASKGG